MPPAQPGPPAHCPVRDPYNIDPCDAAEIAPLVEHLRANRAVDETVVFPRGTLLTDGRLDLCKQSLLRIQKFGLEKSAHIINGDLLTQNYSSADLVTVYLLPESIDNKVQPLLDKQLKKGARVVAHDFEFKAWTPEKVENIPDDGEGRSHTLYLYRK